MKTIRKKDFPLSQLRRYLEPSPTVLVTSRFGDATNIMAMNWYTVMEFSPALIGCIIAKGNYSYELITESKQCVINIPTAAMIDTVVAIGNSDGDAINKFAAFDLTEHKALHVNAPHIAECYASIECKLHDDRLVEKYNFFIFEAVRACVGKVPKYPQTMGYRGDGVFMLSGKNVSRKAGFRKENL